MRPSALTGTSASISYSTPTGRATPTSGVKLDVPEAGSTVVYECKVFKQGEGVTGRKFQGRWFVIWSDDVLRYYKSSERKKLKGVIPLAFIQVHVATQSLDKCGQFTFSLQTAKRTYKCYTATQSERDKVLNNITEFKLSAMGARTVTPRALTGSLLTMSRRTTADMRRKTLEAAKATAAAVLSDSQADAHSAVHSTTDEKTDVDHFDSLKIHEMYATRSTDRPPVSDYDYETDDDAYNSPVVSLTEMQPFKDSVAGAIASGTGLSHVSAEVVADMLPAPGAAVPTRVVLVKEEFNDSETRKHALSTLCGAVAAVANDAELGAGTDEKRQFIGCSKGDPVCAEAKFQKYNEMPLDKGHLICYCGCKLDVKFSSGDASPDSSSADDGEAKRVCFHCGMKDSDKKNVRYLECSLPFNEFHSEGPFRVCSACYVKVICEPFWDEAKHIAAFEGFKVDKITGDFANANVCQKLLESESGCYPHRVGVRVEVLRVCDVHTATQSFRAKVLVFCAWKPTRADVDSWRQMQESGADLSEWQPSWRPRFDWPNASEIHTSEWLPYPCSRGPFVVVTQGGCERGVINMLPFVVSGCLRVDGTFSEEFELCNFPVDCQDLSILMRSADVAPLCHLTLPFNARDVAHLGTDNSLSAWYVHTPQLEFVVKRRSPIASYSQLNLSLKLERKSRGYFSRVLLFICMITMSSLASFALDVVESGAERLEFLVTMLLTAVAYQYAISEELPKGIAYLTLLDKYILWAFSFCFALLVYTALLICIERSGAKHSTVRLLDVICFALAAALFFAAHALFAWHCHRQYLIEELPKLKLTYSQLRAHRPAAQQSEAGKRRKAVATAKFNVRRMLTSF